MSYPLTVVSATDGVSGETVNALEALLAAARTGEIVGIAFCVQLKGRKFLVDAVGEAARDPVLTRGSLLSLDDQLRDMAREFSDS